MYVVSRGTLVVPHAHQPDSGTHGKSNLHEVWPNLELFIHGGINFTPYREQYKRLLPDPKMKYMETYNASEGFFGLQDDPGNSSMLLMLDYGVYYEFVPISELTKPHPRVLLLEEVETGVNYALVISTNGGLWRYMIGDTIMFTSTRPYKFKITGRTKLFINAFGEELIIDNAIEALKQTCEKTGATVMAFTAAPVFMEDGKRSPRMDYRIRNSPWTWKILPISLIRN